MRPVGAVGFPLQSFLLARRASAFGPKGLVVWSVDCRCDPSLLCSLPTKRVSRLLLDDIGRGMIVFFFALGVRPLSSLPADTVFLKA